MRKKHIFNIMEVFKRLFENLNNYGYIFYASNFKINKNLNVWKSDKIRYRKTLLYQKIKFFGQSGREKMLFRKLKYTWFLSFNHVKNNKKNHMSILVYKKF